MKKIKNVNSCINPLLPICLTDCFTEAEEIAKITFSLNDVIKLINILPDELKKYIQENFKSFVLDGQYDAETQTLTLFTREEN